MRLKYINSDAQSPVNSYGGISVKYGDIVDTSVWGDKESLLTQKALASGNYRAVTEGLTNPIISEILAERVGASKEVKKPTLLEKVKAWLPKRK